MGLLICEKGGVISSFKIKKGRETVIAPGPKQR